MMRIEVLYVHSCPNWRRALAMAERLTAELGVEAQLEARLVADAADAERLRFPGSPTVRVDGRDVEPDARERGDYALACRIYRGETGLSGLPDERWLRAALEAAR